MERSGVFQDIDYKNKTKAVPKPTRVNDIDFSGSIYDNIINASDNNALDLSSINSLTQVSQTRDDVYNMLDIMGEDPVISVALGIYTADACEPNDGGQVVWAEADDKRVLGEVTHLLDQLNIDKNAYNWVHSLVKYGDLFLRLFRKSEYKLGIFEKKDNKLNEDVILKAFAKDDHFAEYMEMQRNPAELFDLQMFGKTVGYIRSHIITKDSTDDITKRYSNIYNFNFNTGDVDIYPATDYVHACLEDNISRKAEEVTITNPGIDGDESFVYTVRRGQSVLYDSFRIWRVLSLLENSVVLNRISRSAIIKTVQVEVGDMDKNDVRVLLQRIKGMVEQKSSLAVGKNYEDYTNPGPVENILYIPTHDGKGGLTVSSIGGDVQTDDLRDVKYFQSKLFGSIGIPKQFLGQTDDATGFNGGTSLSLISSQYAKTIKKIQNAFCQAITDAINIILIDKGLNEYVNEFTIRMQAPTTQEEKDRKENISNSISNIREVMGLLDGIEDNVIKLNILKSLLSNTIHDTEVIAQLQKEIDRLEAEKEASEGGAEEGGEGGEEDFGDFGGGEEGGSVPMSNETEEAPAEESGEESGSVPMESPEEPEESFISGEGAEQLNEENNLPTFEELGIDYTDALK